MDLHFNDSHVPRGFRGVQKRMGYRHVQESAGGKTLRLTNFAGLVVADDDYQVE